MPYGLRVGTHRENEELYRNFIARVPYLLKPEGTLILLTADYKLLSDEARRAGLKTVNEFTILSGGLMPRLAVFKLK
jgi:23S rRNA G2445 N2-methylase RlmL